MENRLPTDQAEELAQLIKEYPDWGKSVPGISKAVSEERNEVFHRHLQKTNARVIQRHTGSAPKSIYQDAYHNPKQTWTRNMVKPPEPQNLAMPPNPPAMSFSTVQRSDYTTKDPSVRAQPILLKENYEHPTGAFDGETSYNKAYVPQDIAAAYAALPAIAKDPSRNSKELPSFNGMTTNKEMYKDWRRKPAAKFKELPSFTTSLLYPDRGHDLHSTTQSTYQGHQAPRIGLIKQGDGNIHMEGEHDMTTTSKAAYPVYSNPQAAERVVQYPKMPVKNRAVFDHKSRSHSDYGSCYTHGMPRPAQPVPALQESLAIGYDNNTHFVSEQQAQFHGIDIETHPPPKPIMREGQTRMVSAGAKIAQESCTQEDYKAPEVYEPRTSKSVSYGEGKKRNLPKFEAETSNNHFYKDWKVKPRKRYVDFLKGHAYVPSVDKFDGSSTTKSTFTGTCGPTSAPFHPIESKSLKRDGDIDFGTVYQANYDNQSVQNTLKKLDKNQLGELLSGLRRRKWQDTQFTEKQLMQQQETV